jgi:sugar O-acyltransferase (sialic acid O-acetyltransferase NeuD family)
MSSRKPIVLLGAGGHCLSCIEVIESGSEYEVVALLESNESEARYGYKIFQEDQYIKNFSSGTQDALIAVGQIKSHLPRKNLYAKLVKVGFKLPVIRSCSSLISNRSDIDRGTIVMHGVKINASVHIGCNVILNTGCIIEHGVKVGDHCHISTGAIINGDVSIGDNCFIGSGSVIHDGVTIPENSIISAGSVIKRKYYERK